jgi:CRISPR-associated endonuclease/helicase Cas3
MLSKPWTIDRVVGALEKNAFAGWQRSRWLSGVLVLVLDERNEATVAGFRLRYSDQWGLEVERESA